MFMLPALVLSGIVLAPAQASVLAGLGTSVIVNDGIRSAKGPTANDIYRVEAFSANVGEPASVTINFNGPISETGSQEILVYFNTDRDSLPEAALAMSGYNYRAVKTSRWAFGDGKDLTACAKPSTTGLAVSVEFSPGCLGAAKRMSFHVQSHTPGLRTDFVPAPKTWTRAIRATS